MRPRTHSPSGGGAESGCAGDTLGWSSAFSTLPRMILRLRATSLRPKVTSPTSAFYKAPTHLDGVWREGDGTFQVDGMLGLCVCGVGFQWRVFRRLVALVRLMGLGQA